MDGGENNLNMGHNKSIAHLYKMILDTCGPHEKKKTKILKEERIAVRTILTWAITNQ